MKPTLPIFLAGLFVLSACQKDFPAFPDQPAFDLGTDDLDGSAADLGNEDAAQSRDVGDTNTNVWATPEAAWRDFVSPRSFGGTGESATIPSCTVADFPVFPIVEGPAATRYRVASVARNDDPVLAVARTVSVGGANSVVELSFVSFADGLLDIESDATVSASVEVSDVVNSPAAYDVITWGNQVLFAAATSDGEHFVRCAVNDTVICTGESIQGADTSDAVALFVDPLPTPTWAIVRLNDGELETERIRDDSGGTVVGSVPETVFNPGMSLGFLDAAPGPDGDLIVTYSLLDSQEYGMVWRQQSGMSYEGVLDLATGPTSTPNLAVLDYTNGVGAHFQDDTQLERAGLTTFNISAESVVTGALDGLPRTAFDLCGLGRDPTNASVHYGIEFKVDENGTQDTYLVRHTTFSEPVTSTQVNTAYTNAEEVEAACDELGAWAVYRTGTSLNIHRFFAPCTSN